MAVDFADRMTATRVVNFLEVTVKRLGKPTSINFDRGEPLQIPALIEWCRNAGVTVHFRPAARPDAKGRVERGMERVELDAFTPPQND